MASNSLNKLELYIQYIKNIVKIISLNIKCMVNSIKNTEKEGDVEQLLRKLALMQSSVAPRP